jgi:hypothetical protein
MADIGTTVGVDFAASPKNTAACEIRWSPGGAVVERAGSGVDDAAFLSLLEDVPKGGRLGLDCPLAWPVAFVSAVHAHRQRAPCPYRGCADRTELRWRARMGLPTTSEPSPRSRGGSTSRAVRSRSSCDPGST